jgi:hypothetical protein
MKRWLGMLGIVLLGACSDDGQKNKFLILSDFEPIEGSRVLANDTIAGAFVWKIEDENFSPNEYYIRAMFHDQDGKFNVPDTVIVSHYFAVKSDSASGIYYYNMANAYADLDLGRPIRCRYELIHIDGGIVEIIDATKTLKYSD